MVKLIYTDSIELNEEWSDTTSQKMEDLEDIENDKDIVFLDEQEAQKYDEDLFY